MLIIFFSSALSFSLFTSPLCSEHFQDLPFHRNQNESPPVPSMALRTGFQALPRLIPPTVSQLPAQLQPLRLLAVSYNPHAGPSTSPPRAEGALVPIPPSWRPHLLLCRWRAPPLPFSCLPCLISLASPGEIGVTIGLLWG